MSRRTAAAARRLQGVRTVAATGLAANRPKRRRRPAPDVPQAVVDRDVVLPDLDLTAAPWPGESVDVGGTQVFVRHTPTTSPTPVPTALYVHGLGGASTNWTDLAAQLAPFVEAWSLDLPGFGRSGPSATGEYTIRSHTRTVLTYLEQLAANGSGPVHLFGNSMGGAVAIAVAARRPDLVRTLTLISPAVPDLRMVRDDDPRTVLMLVPGVSGAVQRRLASLSPHDRARGVVTLCFGDPSRVPDHRIDEAAAEIEYRAGMAWGDRAFGASMKSLVGTWFSARPWHDMARITAPTLVIWGDRDKLVSPALAPTVTATIPRASLLVLPGVGHVAQLEDPVTTARAWLGTLGPAATPATEPAASPASEPAAAGS